MKLIVFGLAAACLILAALYFALPADSLPAWLPGYEAGMTRARVKHGIAAAAAGAVLCFVGWFVGRRA
jgi:hypothetical protein